MVIPVKKMREDYSQRMRSVGRNAIFFVKREVGS